MPLFDCSITCGNFPIITHAGTVRPKCGWDLQTLNVAFDRAAGNVWDQLDGNTLNLGDQYNLEANGGQMFIQRQNIKETGNTYLTGALEVGLSMRGFIEAFPALGMQKFVRLPYSSSVESQTVTHDDVAVSYVGKIRGTNTNVTYDIPIGKSVRWFQPKVTYQECYLANADFFDPCSNTVRSLNEVGGGTMHGFDTENITNVLQPENNTAGLSDVDWRKRQVINNPTDGVIDPGTISLWPWGDRGDQTPLAAGDVGRSNEFTTAGTEAGYDFPLMSLWGASNFNNTFIEHRPYGWVLESRAAEEVCVGGNIWYVTDTISFYNRFSFA